MIKITTDSTCDLPAHLLERYNISVIPLGIVKGDRLYRDGTWYSDYVRIRCKAVKDSPV